MKYGEQADKTLKTQWDGRSRPIGCNAVKNKILLGRGLVGAVANDELFAVGIEGFLSNALDLQQIIDRLERPMLLAVVNDGLSLLRANAVQRGQCLGVGG